MTYEPSPVAWTDYYEPSVTELYYYEPSTQTYTVDNEPSPFTEYFYYSEST